ncbi:hypothetical protein Q8A67_020184 [Cirrhinus molitorella]|uniref:Uncharacterized protein n=1 Tax=Cirrhinus molitorella TaxID=172907 RepID=A0AA88PBC8_9TELE|nr:hypothetical protein Q8A67_020184 [Cirrhinus molitorella]
MIRDSRHILTDGSRKPREISHAERPKAQLRVSLAFSLSLNGPVAYEQLPVRLKLLLAVMHSPADTQSHSAVFSSAAIHFWQRDKRLLARTVNALYA